MMLTLLAPSTSLPPVVEACNFLKMHDVAFGEVAWVKEGAICDIPLKGQPEQAVLNALYTRLREDWGCDVLLQPARKPGAIKLFIADMDATMLQEETLDTLAEDLGLGARIIPITQAAMKGEIDFETALNQRVALLKDVPESALGAVWQRATICEGADYLLTRLKAQGVYCVLVSGGFTFFTEKLAEKLGFDAHHGNQLAVENGRLNGTVIPPILGADAKLARLHYYCETLAISPAQVFAIGDGANDIPMLQAAGLGVAYRGKAKTRAACPHAQLNHANLADLADALLG